MRFDIAFYKAKFGGIDDKIIDWGSGKKGYSHCEIVINDTTMIGSHYLAKGVKKFYYNNIYSNPRWDVIRLPQYFRKKAISYAENMIGTKYDAIGAVLYWMNLPIYSDTNKVWCSELCAEALNITSNKSFDTLIMPNDLFNVMENLGGYIVKRTTTDIPKMKYSRRIISVNKPIIDRYGRIAYAN